VEHREGRGKPAVSPRVQPVRWRAPWRRDQREQSDVRVEQLYLYHVRAKSDDDGGATMARHLTPKEIALNRQELTCRAEIEKLEMQEAQLDLELEQDIGESGKMLVMYTLEALHKELLAKHRELEQIKNGRSFLYRGPFGDMERIKG